MKWKLGFVGAILMAFHAQVSFAQQSIPVSGSWNIAEQNFFVDVNTGTDKPFRIDIKRNDKYEYDIELSLTKWTFTILEVSTILKGSLKIKFDEEGNSYIIGRVSSQYTLLNDKVIDNIESDFFIYKQKLVIRSLTVGPLSSYGTVELNVIPEADITVQFSELPLKDVMNFSDQTIVDANGVIEGRLRFKGPWDQFQIQGELQSFNGYIDPHKYNAAEIHFEGTYPRIQLYNSHVAQTDGLSFELQGSLDLTDWSIFKQQLHNLVKTPLITDDGEAVEWTFKRLQSEDGKGTTEFKYMLRNNGEKEDGLLGIERRMEF